MKSKEANIESVKSKFPTKEGLRADEHDQLRRVLNFYGLNENDVYEKSETTTVTEEA